MNNTAHTSEERIWAALAHASGLLFFFGLAPLLIWTTQRRKSAYVAFHALQAFGYQTISIVLWMLASFILPFLSVLLIIPIAIFLEQFQPEAAIIELITPIAMMVLFILPLVFIIGVYWLCSLLGAVFVLIDKDFRYPLMGSWLARYLGYASGNQTPLNTEAEERWVAGIGHTSVSIVFFGMLVPLATWLAEKNRSMLIRFQSLQTLIYQGLGALGYFFMQIGYLAFYFIFFGGMVLAGTQAENLTDSSVFSGIAILFFLLTFCCGGVMMVATPLYYLLALFATVRVIRGHNFKYPLLGALIWNKQNKPIVVNTNTGEQNVNQ